MAHVLFDGETKIGAYKFLDRKKFALCVEQGNKVVVYGYFNTEEGANKFMDILARFVGAREEEANHD